MDLKSLIRTITGSGAKAAARSRFESCKQRFFGALLLSAKLPTVIAAIEQHLAADQSVVLQLVSTAEAILDRRLGEPAPYGFEEIVLGMGCYWGVERLFWEQDGVWLTEVGFAGGETENPTYDEVKTGTTGHAEVVRVVYDPSRISTEQILKRFWENHDPTQGNRQGNDVGTQYRSAIYWTTPQQERAARETSALFQEALDDAGRGAITTEMRPADEAGPFWPAELYHQQYLSKHPGGYCNHGPNGCRLPTL